MAAAVVGAAISATVPLLIRHVIDTVLSKDPHRGVGVWIAILVVLAVVQFATTFARRFSAGRLSLDVQYDMRDFFDKWQAAKGHFEPSADPAADFAVVPPGSPQRQAADAGIECIGCGICHSACDVVAWDRDYLGPAALNRAWTLVNDVRDRGNAARMDAVSAGSGCHLCHTHMSCTQFCPKGLAPTYAIAGLKRAMVARAFGRKP